MTDALRQEILKLLHYCPDTGRFTWKVGNNRRAVGDVAGNVVGSGYRVITVKGKNWYAHRLAWFLHHGQMPEGQVDHRDGDRANCRIANLRVVSVAGNQRNKRRPHCDSRTGYLGVTKSGNRFRSYIGLNGKSIYLGSFGSAEEAHQAYLNKKREIHESCTI